MSDNKLLKISLAANLMCIILFALLSNKYDKSEKVPVVDAVAEEKIRNFTNLNVQLKLEIDSLHLVVDSLNARKANTKIIYREKIKFIDSANSEQLDSIIRSNW